MTLKQRRIVVGITGGIAAYKGAGRVRLLVKQGAAVQVVMTAAAERFITRLTLQSLAGRPVASEIFDLDEESRIGHIRIADEAELLVVAPASAHTIARLAHGLADDLLTTVALATRAPLLLAPAMNVNMWAHPATRANVELLGARGATVVGPDAGDLACGWVGAGRLIEPPEIVAACERILARVAPDSTRHRDDGAAAGAVSSSSSSSSSPSSPGASVVAAAARDLDGVPILITAGPTHEAIDPVRFIGNRSSGKMGFALARQAAARGARVTIVAGPVELATPPGVERVDVTTAAEMLAAVLAREESVACVIKAAAVADFRPSIAKPTKMKKGDDATMTLVLERNPDILATLVERRRARGSRGPVIVGFAAETGNLDAEAEAKLRRKGCDLLVGNDVSRPVFGSDDNEIVIYSASAPPERLPRTTKDAAASAILDRVRSLL